MMTTRVNRLAEALKENGNLVGLAGSAALSAATLNPLPLLVGIVAEAAYLLFLPDTKWYQDRLERKREFALAQKRALFKAQVLPTLSEEMQKRYLRLEQVRREIGTHPTDWQSYLHEVLRKLDYLLDKFLVFASKEVQFRRYLRGVLRDVRAEKGSREKRPVAGGPTGPVQLDAQGRPIIIVTKQKGQLPAPPRPVSIVPAEEKLEIPMNDSAVEDAVQEIQQHYDREMEVVRGKLEECEQDTGAVLQKRLEVLQRRHEFVGKIGGILVNLNHQLQLLADTFGLINDEVRARPPEQILLDIEDVVGQTDIMNRVLEEVAPYEQMAERLSA